MMLILTFKHRHVHKLRRQFSNKKSTDKCYKMSKHSNVATFVIPLHSSVHRYLNDMMYALSTFSMCA